MSLGLPFFLLYQRKQKWYTPRFKRMLAMGMSSVGLLGFLLSNTNNYRFLFYSLLTTPIFILLESLFKRFSIQKHHRDFYLWLRYSNDIDDSLSGMGTNTHVKTSDKIFSITLLLFIVGLCVWGAVLFGKNGLYDQLID